MKRIFFFLFALAIFASCNNSQFKGFDQTESGLYYKIIKSGGDTIKAAKGDMMNVEIYYRTLENAPIDSNYKVVPMDIKMRPSIYKGDIFEGLRLLSAGDSAVFVASTDSFFTKLSGSSIPPTLDSGSFFYIDVKVNSIESMASIEAKEEARNDELKAEETGLLQQYIADNNVTETPDSNGIYMIFSKKGKGKVIEAGKYAKVHLTISSVKDNLPLYNSKDQMADGIELMVGTGYFGIGFDLCLTGSKIGDIFKAIVPSSMAFGERGVERIVPPFTTLVYNCEVLNVYTEDEYAALSKKKNDERLAKQLADIKAYVKKNGINGQPDSDGIYKKIIKEGSGDAIGNGKMVNVLYTGTLLDGTVFDSNQNADSPFKFNIGAAQVIPGWDKMVAGMKIGEKALIVIPSDMAYGSQQKGPIPAYSPLAFEIEVLSVDK